MSLYYVDPESGVDGNSGLTFALRKKSIPTVAAGDTVRVIKSVEPQSLGVNGTFTDGSNTVVLASALNLNIERCETAWTAGATVTASTTASCREGSAGITFVCSQLAAGIIGIKAATPNTSPYQQVCMWFKTTAAIAAGDLTLRLCSDIVGLVPVNTISLPAVTVLNKWVPILIDFGSALTSLTASLSIATTVVKTGVTFSFDNIFAVKAPGDTALSLFSLIGKNTAGESFWPIQSINGTSVMLDTGSQSAVGAHLGYVGTTATIAAVKQEPLQYVATANITVAAGTAASRILITGGWNRTDMSTQTGVSWITFIHNSSALFLGVFNDLEKIRTVYSNSIVIENANTLNDVHFMAGTNVGFQGLGCGSVITDLFVHSCSVAGISIGGTNHRNTFTGLKVHSCAGGSGVEVQGNLNRITTANIKRNAGYAVLLYSASYRNFFKNLTTANNASGVFRNQDAGGRENLAVGTVFSEGTFVSNSSTLLDERLYSEKHNGVATDHRQFSNKGTSFSEAGADRRTASGLAWKLTPSVTNASEQNPFNLNVAKVAVASGALVTVKAWMKRSAGTVAGKLFIRGGQVNGVDNDLSAAIVGTAAYEELTLTFTPSETGVVEIEAHAYGTGDVFIDDMTLS